MSFFKRRRHPHPDQLAAEDHDTNVDQDLRLRTVRTAASTIAESIASEQRAERRRSVRHNRSKFFRSKLSKHQEREQSSIPIQAPSPAQISGNRRNIYLNMPLTAMEVDRHGEPVARYARNKCLVFCCRTFLMPHRILNTHLFLLNKSFSVFPIFGAVSPQTAALPLMFILAVTAIKDAIEDYRRATLDEEVNTSAATKLGNWQNINQPKDPRNSLERLLGLNAPGHVTKGVRRLREREASEGSRIILSRAGNRPSFSVTGPSSLSLDSGSGKRLEDIQSVDSHSYPPLDRETPPQPSFSASAQNLVGNASSATLTAASSSGVMDWSKRISGSARWERTLWKKLEVGDIVLLRDNEQVPADIVILSTSDPDGLCYLETKNLDGETNLKPRKAVNATSSILSEEDIERSAFVLDSEPPHPNLYLYNGVLRFRDQVSDQSKTEPVTINEMLLRGCSIRNTAWVVGLVVFTGKDTKIMLNGGDTPSKRSKIEKETNFNVIVNFVVLISMCTVSAVVNGIFDARTGTSAAVFEAGSNPSSSNIVDAFITFASCLIAFQNIVPISLYISIEIVKTIQAFFISQDIDMYYKPLESACVPKTWNISDDLGQIEYIFSDKTGTLTQNIMEFQKCSIHGVTYGEVITEAQRGAARRQGRTDLPNPVGQSIRMANLRQEMLSLLNRAFKNRYVQEDKLTLVSTKLAEDLTDRSGEQRAHIVSFFRALAVCHNVLADKPGLGQDPSLLGYKAESPDESALVGAARDVGFPFIGKSRERVDIEVMGQPESYVLLKVLDFNSTRKRMSVIVRNPQGQIVLYCKGADSVIYERLAANHDSALEEKTSKDMETFANGGLRTLCVAYRLMSDEEYLEWSRVYDAAASSIKDRDEEIDKANALVEHSLHVLGATGLEDKLQEGVPEAIEMLHAAGIKLWILTGDKVQTAIEIAFSCNLLKSDMEIMILSADTVDGARVQIEAGLNKIASVLGPPSRDPRKRGFSSIVNASFAIVIDGDTLRHALDPSLKPLFLNLGTQCETVVCCRVSPAQKALTVKLVKEGRNAMTLSIGDGANDVAMIQEANVGVGLFGLEGSQAAMSADYAFGQFRFLTKLLIVHGRWSYRRIADMHSNFFYKVSLVIVPIAGIILIVHLSFDATYLYQYTFILLYNLLFTSLPVATLGAFDQDINAKAAMAFPQLYVRGIRGLEYTRTKFWLYMLDGLYHNLVDGKTIESLADFGTTVAVAAIVTANTYVGINTHYWTIITWIIIPGSSLLMLLWIVVYSFLESFDFIDEVQRLCGGVTFWAAVILSVAIALLPRVLVKFVSTSFAPQDADIIRYMWVKGDLKRRLGIKPHRGQQAPVDGSPFASEATPMFREPHARSISEMTTPDGYEPALSRSPGDHTPPMQPEQVHDTPPQIIANLEDSSSRRLPTTVTDTGEEDMAPPTPTKAAHAAALPPSPQPSYYSASDIPVPSPLPSPDFQHHSQTDPTMPPISYSRPLRGQYPSQVYSDSLQVPPNLYEMHIRNPIPGRDSQPERRDLSEITEVSYATVTEVDPEGRHRPPSSTLDGDARSRPLSYEGPTAL
ncbi:phospholipid-translocating P-type ATPase [Lactarius quietus]|nr:phospholipid-translocating P-type ATPase [Lactarius quietus]